MFRRKGIVLAAACAALVCGRSVRAENPTAPAAPTAGANHPYMLDDNKAQPATSPSPDNGAPPAPIPPTPPDATPAPVAPLMGALDRTPIGQGMDKLGISAYGWVEGSWTYDDHPPAGNVLTQRAFDTKTESLQFDQLDLTLTRSIDSTKPFDIGFTVEQMYGWDSAYIHSNGLSIYSPGKTASPIPGTGSTLTIHPKAQYDLTQANAVFGFNVWHGMSVEVGKFATLLGYEVIDPWQPTGGTQNLFFSHSYIFTQEPFTHTGALYSVTLPANLTLTGGITRGWDQATNDSNGSIDYTAQLKYISDDKKLNLALNGITGDEQPHGTQNGWRSVLDFVGSYQLADQLSVGVNGMFAWEAQTSELGFGGGTGIWYAVAAYASYVPDPHVSFNLRAEWFDDQDGAAPTAYGPARISNQYYELTAGVTIHPLPNNPYFRNLAIRPEARVDYANHATWNGGTQNYNMTAAIEAYWAF